VQGLDAISRCTNLGWRRVRGRRTIAAVVWRSRVVRSRRAWRPVGRRLSRADGTGNATVAIVPKEGVKESSSSIAAGDRAQESSTSSLTAGDRAQESTKSSLAAGK
jgi:hypothetical protein